MTCWHKSIIQPRHKNRLFFIVCALIAFSFFGNEASYAQDNNILFRSTNGSGGILFSQNSNYLHSATFGETIVGESQDPKHIVLSGFWATPIPFTTRIESDASVEQEKFHLSQNYPNPFKSITYYDIMLPKRATVSITVFDISGRIVRYLINDKVYNPGIHKFSWDGKDQNGRPIPSGSYFYKLMVYRQSANSNTNIQFQTTKKMMIL